MQRRELLAACCTGCGAVLAGCSSADPFDDSSEAARERRHPFADATVAVRVANRSDTDHDVEANAREAMAYWEENAEQYLGFDVEFDVVESDAELTIAYVDSPDPWCRDVDGYSERVLGCAPLLGPQHRVPDDLTAYVVAAARPYGKVRITTKHEIGHVLGLYHDDEPREIMSNRPEDRIPLYGVRIDIWEDVLAANERSTDGTRLFDLGVSSWSERSYAAAEASFSAANDEYERAGRLVEGALDRTDEFEGHPQVETVALDDLRALLGRLRERTSAAEEFTARMTAASAAAGADDAETANDELDRANGAIRAFNALEPVELRDVAIALGLVRGFDRDDAVVDVDEDEI